MKKITLDKNEILSKKFELLKSKVTSLTSHDMTKAVGGSGYTAFSKCFCGGGTGVGCATYATCP